MARQITGKDISQGFWSGTLSKLGITDEEIYGTDFKDNPIIN